MHIVDLLGFLCGPFLKQRLRVLKGPNLATLRHSDAADKSPELLFVSIGDSYVEAEAAVDLATWT